MKEKLADVTWQQATKPVDSLHTISALVYHMNYFVSATLKVLQGGPLDAKEKYSFDQNGCLSSALLFARSIAFGSFHELSRSLTLI